MLLLLLFFLTSINHWELFLLIIPLCLSSFLTFFFVCTVNLLIILSHRTKEYKSLWFNILNRSTSNTITVDTLLMLWCAIRMSWRNMLIRNIIIHKELLFKWRTIGTCLIVLNMNEITAIVIIVIVLKHIIMIGLMRSWRFQ